VEVRPKRILWPTDFSQLSLVGARYARAFCELYDAPLHIVHVSAPPLSPDVAANLPADVPAAYSDGEVIEACRKTLDRLIEEEFAGMMGVQSQVRIGNPWSAICEYAREQAIDLIVVATHGRTGLQHVLIGSTAERIVQHAPCPVLVVKNVENGFVTD
jgi:nucleotide-binding universal stress UspA family protein